MNDPKEFAQRVSGLILDQIDRDRHINRENIAFTIEKELGRNPEPRIEIAEFMGSAYTMLVTWKNHEKPASGRWSPDAQAAARHLAVLMAPFGYDPWRETKP